MRDHSSLIKKSMVVLSTLIGISWCGHELFLLIPLERRGWIFNNVMSLFGHQLGFFFGRALLKKIYQNSKTEWPLLATLYLVTPLLVFIVSKNMMLQSLGLGRFAAGFASIGVWILMERLLEVRSKPKQWSRYFSFYIVFYHLSGLCIQAWLGTPLFASRHAWASMLAFLVLATVLPSFLLWSEGVEIERVSLFKQFFKQSPAAYFPWLNTFNDWSKQLFMPRPHYLNNKASKSAVIPWKLWGIKVVNWKHFNDLFIGLAGVFLGCLSAAYPIYFRVRKTACLFPMPFFLGLVWLILGNIIGSIFRPHFLKFSALWRLKIDLMGIALSALLFLKIKAMYAFSINLIFLGCVCHMLYPDLMARMQQWSTMKPLPEVRQKIENCLQYANHIFVIVSIIDRMVSPSLASGSQKSIDDFLYYFLSGYLFLFCFALIPDEADHLVMTGKRKIKVWIHTKHKTVAQKVLEEIKTIKAPPIIKDKDKEKDSKIFFVGWFKTIFSNFKK